MTTRSSLGRAVTATLLAGVIAAAAAGASSAQVPQQARDRTGPPAAGTAVVSGVVVTDDDSATPLRRVAVTLNSVDGRYGATAVTDSAGRYIFAEVPAGRYDLVASRAPYVTTRHGARTIGRSGTPIAIADGDRREITLRMPLGGVVTGMVRDERGQPVEDVRVELLRYSYATGRRALNRSTGGATDDRGVYRLFGVAPGEYYVSINPPRIGTSSSAAVTTAEELRYAEDLIAGRLGRTTAGASAPSPPAAPTVGYARIYYPGSADEANAQALQVEPGSVHDGIDFQLQYQRLAAISGRAIKPDGAPAERAMVHLASPAGTLSGLSLSFTDTDGTFTIRGVAPGRYTLAVLGSNKPDESAPTPLPTGPHDIWGTTDLTLTGEDLTRVEIRMQPSMTASVRVVAEGGETLPSGMRVGLLAVVEGDDVATTTGNQPVEGTTTFRSIIPGNYRVVATLPDGWSIRAVRIGSDDLTDLPFEVRAGVAVEDIEVEITQQVASLTGVMSDETGRASTDYQMILFADDPSYWPAGPGRIKTARPATDGRFEFPNVPPGAYRLAAVSDVETNQWFDPAFLEALLPASIAVTLIEGEMTTQDVRIAGGGSH